MYYFNLIIFYSLLGFILESVVYKISKSNEHSSIFYGPYTLVYGFGVLACILVFNFLKYSIALSSPIIFTTFR